MKISKLSLIFIFWVWIFSVKVQAQNILSITDYGYIPGSKENVIPALKAAIQDASASVSVAISFPKGRYDFYPTIPAYRGNQGIRFERH